MPGSGKTTLGKFLSEKFSVPLVSKDDIKEILYDNLGYSDIEFSQKLGRATFDLMYYVMRLMMNSQASFVIESPFKRELASGQIEDLRSMCGFKIIQIHCKAEPKVLSGRIKERWENGNRHPGHQDGPRLGQVDSEVLSQKQEPLDIKGKLIEIDTVDFKKVSYNKICKEIESYM